MQRKVASLPRRICVRLCLAAGIAVAFLAVWTVSRDALLSMYWENELAAATGEPAATALERLVSLGQPGLKAAVRALGVSRDHIDDAAFLALNRELDRWARRPPDDAVAELEDLAEALADHFEQLPSRGQSRALKLAMRILLWRRDASVFDGGRLTAACDRILNASGRPTRSSVKPKAVAAAVRRRDRPDAASTPHALLPADRSMYLELAELAPPVLPRADRAGGAAPAQPRILFPTDAAALASKAQGGQSDAGKAPAAEGPVAVASYTLDENGAQKDEPANEARQRMRTLKTLELFAQLNESGEAARAAAAELNERGFSPRQIEVGRRLCSPDAAERLRWTETLPGIRGIDARFWLLRLSHDSNIQVRRCAVGLLATDRDPEVIRRLQEIVVSETDAQLRNQASRALEVLQGP